MQALNRAYREKFGFPFVVAVRGLSRADIIARLRARVGNDANPYQLRTVYNGSPNKYNGQPQFTYSDVIANAGLKPEITTSADSASRLSRSRYSLPAWPRP